MKREQELTGNYTGSYHDWHSSMHDDEPRDQERELRVDGGYWASAGPDSRQAPGGWSWDIQQFDGVDNRDVAGGFSDSEEAAKQAVDTWEAVTTTTMKKENEDDADNPD